MGSKKRESSSALESAVENGEDKQKLNVSSENADVEPSRKRTKKEKKKKDIELPETESVNDADADAAPASSSAHKASLNSMERKKHRKLQDKVRHGADDQKIDSGPEKMNVELKIDGNESGGTSSSGGGVLPKFHIGVFKELGAADASVRKAAAKTLVVELREVQNAYDKLENKDEVEDKSNLEAEKDDGLNNCAPSVRYAVRRLIRGVSSSRECARQGFALGLTMLVGMVHSIKLESLLKLITTLLEVSSSMKGVRRLKTAYWAVYLHMELLQDRESLLKNGYQIIVVHSSKNLTNVLLILQLRNGTYKSLLLLFYWR